MESTTMTCEVQTNVDFQKFDLEENQREITQSALRLRVRNSPLSNHSSLKTMQRNRESMRSSLHQTDGTGSAQSILSNRRNHFDINDSLGRSFKSKYNNAPNDTVEYIKTM